jgi:hypothetical protein
VSVGKKRSDQHLIDQDGIGLLRTKLPRHWLLREYRPDYGLDFTIETFKAANAGGAAPRPATFETLGEHVRGGSVYLNRPARLLSGAAAGFMPLREAVG